MSVVPMKMVTIAGPAAYVDDIICTCLVNHRFSPVETTRAHSSNRGVPFDWDNIWQEPLQTVQALMEDFGISYSFEDFRGKHYNADSANAYLDNLVNHKQQIETQRALLCARIGDTDRSVNDLNNFLALPSELNELYRLDHIRMRFGRMPREAYDSLTLKAQHIDELMIYPTQVTNDYVYLVFVVPVNYIDSMDALVSSLGFEKIRLTSRTEGTASETARMLTMDRSQCETELDLLETDFKAWIESETSTIRSIYSYFRFMYEAGEIKRYAVHSEPDFVLRGWIPAEDLDNLTTDLSHFPDVMIVDADRSGMKSETPPVLLKNNFWGRLFEPFTKMYGLPSYGEFDPTFLMAVTYSILFGIMYGDVGQGLVLIALGIFLYKVKHVWLGGILGSVGVFSVIFGFIFGSFFGNEEIIPGFHVLESGSNATRILLISAGIGVVLIVMMMIINIINGIRQKDAKKVLVTNNSIAGMVFYLAVVIGAVLLVATGNNIFTVPYILILIVLPVIIMFCQEPLGKLLARRKDWKPDSIGGFIAENFFEMFEVLLSFVTNTVSFLRVGAYAICHAGMMLVVFTLAGDPANPVVLVIGNILVMGIEGLMVCIQVLRLEFYEMFGRFYESGGTPFTPSIVDYTNKIEF